MSSDDVVKLKLEIALRDKRIKELEDENRKLRMGMKQCQICDSWEDEDELVNGQICFDCRDEKLGDNNES